MTVSVVRRLDDLDLPEWDARQPRGGFYASSPWLRHAERSGGPGPAPFYFQARENGALLLTMPAYALDADSPFLFCRADHVLGHLTAGHEPPRRADSWTAALMPSLACGGRNPAATVLGFDRSRSVQERRALAAGLVAAAERVARREGLRSVSYLYTDTDTDTDDSADAAAEVLPVVLAAAGYVALPSPTAYSLRLGDMTFDDYLGRFSKARRRQIKRDERALKEAGVRYRVQPLTGRLARDLAPLEAQLYSRHGNPVDEKDLGAIMESIAGNLPGHAEVLTAGIGGELSGFVLFFHRDGELYARQAGFDYARKGDLPLYFGIVYYEMIRLALARAAGRIHYSTGSGRAKESRGCAGAKKTAYLQLFDPAAHETLRRLAAETDNP
jgi:predicted N-acyltransferase